MGLCKTAALAIGGGGGGVGGGRALMGRGVRGWEGSQIHLLKLNLCNAHNTIGSCPCVQNASFM